MATYKKIPLTVNAETAEIIDASDGSRIVSDNLPSLCYGETVILCVSFVDSNLSPCLFNSDDQFEFSMDKDFVHEINGEDDPLMAYSANSQVDILGDWTDIDRTQGKISIRVDCLTTGFAEKIGSSEQINIWIEIKRYIAGSSAMSEILRNKAYAINTVRKNEGIPTSASPEYYDTAAVNALLTGKQAISEKGAANGYAGLDEVGKVPSAQLPASGSGDMLATTYDPTTKAADAFDMGNMAEATDAKIMTAAERAKLGNAPDDTNAALAGKSATDHTHGELHSHTNSAALDNVSDAGDGSQFLADDGSYKAVSASGSGDMLATTYDPTTKAADAFDMGNMAEAADAKIMIAAERAKLGNAPDDTNAALAAKSATDHTHGELHSHTNSAALDNVSDAGDGSQFLADDGSYKAVSASGSGDMLATTYDPTTKAADAFDMGNMAEAADAKIMIAAERAKLGNAPDDTNAALAAKSATDHTHGDLHNHTNSSTLAAIPDHAAAATGQVIKKQSDGSLGFEAEAGGSVDLSSIQNNLLTLSILANANQHGLDKGFTDNFANEVGIATKTNATYDATGDYYAPTPPASSDVTSAGTITSSSGVAASCHDNNTGTYTTLAGTFGTQYVQYDCGSGNTKSFSKVRYYTNGDTNNPIGYSIKGSNDGTNWTTLLASTLALSSAWHDLTFTASAQYRYIRFYSTSSTTMNTETQRVPELQFYAVGTLPNVTLISTSAEALIEPTSARIMLMVYPIDSVTINTDVLVYVSLDNGVNYEQVTLSKIGDYSNTIQLWAGTEDLIDRSDKTIKIKVTTANNKNIRLYAWGVLWS